VIVAALIAIPGAVVAGLLLKGAIGGDEGSKKFPNGSDVRLLGQPSRAERAANERRRRQLRRRVRCVRRAAAAGNRAAVQRCLTR
jgi:hypothetical protein